MQSFPMLDLNSGIQEPFLSKERYRQTLAFSRKRHDNYMNFCLLIQQYYMDFMEVAKAIGRGVKPDPTDQLEAVRHFNQFIADFAKIISDVSEFKVEYYQILADSELDPVRRPTEDIILRTENYSQAQAKFLEAAGKAKETEKNFEGAFGQLKKDLKEPVVYFDQKFTRSKVASLKEMLSSRQEREKEGNELLEHVFHNSLTFETELGKYRHKMVSAKYKTHKKLIEMAKGARECLTQTLISLYDSVVSRHRDFKNMLRQSIRESSLLHKAKRRTNLRQEESADKLSEIIISVTQEYNDLIKIVETGHQALEGALQLMSQHSEERRQSAKQIREELNRMYEQDENPTIELMETLDLFNYFSVKLGELPNQLHIFQANIMKLRQNINKHSEITLSLLKCRGMVNSTTGPATSSKNVDQLGHLFEQLSYDYIYDIMERIYKLMDETLSSLKNYFNMKYHIKKKNTLDDSMDVSYIEEEYVKPQKKPSKEEKWLWKDFRDRTNYQRITPPQDAIDEARKLMQPLESIKVESEKELSKFTCSLSHKRAGSIKGELRLLEKNFMFEGGGIQVNIPLEYVEEVTTRVKIFEKELSVVTSMGEVRFPYFPELPRAELLMQQQLEAVASSPQGNKKQSVELTPEEVSGMTSRKARLEAERETLDGYEVVESAVIPDSTIDAVYDLIYSDKPFKYKGKEECCFFAYVMHKQGGKDYATTRFDPPGPKFYTQEEGIDFTTAPSFSTRTNKYQVPLPPIPFIPPFCTSTEEVRIYWVSNEEFDYAFKSVSEGAPYADCFYLNFLHRVAKKETGVEIKVYSKITFVKDTAMRGMVTSKSKEQSKTKTEFLLKECLKIYKVMGGVGGSSKEVQEAVGAEADASMEESRRELSKTNLDKYKNVIIIVLIVVLVVNFVLQLFF